MTLDIVNFFFLNQKIASTASFSFASAVIVSFAFFIIWNSNESFVYFLGLLTKLMFFLFLKANVGVLGSESKLRNVEIRAL